MPGPNTFSYSGIVLPVLVPLVEMKAHLHITDNAHDNDIIAISAAGQDAVLAFLGGASIDPSWTSTTVSKAVAHAIKLATGFYYEHRGDDEADAVKLWTEIGHLLGRHRDPALA